MKAFFYLITRYFIKYKCIGLQIGLKLFFGYTKNISVPNIKEPIYLRKNTSDIKVFDQLFYSLEYEFEYFFEPKFIIDAGANIGLASVFFANKFKNAQIIAIEPENSNFEILQKNTRKYPAITCLQKAVSNKIETVYVMNSKYGNWGFTTSNDNSLKTNSVNSITTITISQIMQLYELQRIDVLKIDIEGYEKELFETNIDWLPKTKCLIIELHDGIKHGCSKVFFDRISKLNFSFSIKGENLIFFNNEL